MTFPLPATRVVPPVAAAALLVLVTGCSAPAQLMTTGDPKSGDQPSIVIMDNPGPHQILVYAPALDANGNPATTPSGKPRRVRLHIKVGPSTGTSSRGQYSVDHNPAQDEAPGDGK